MKIVVKILTALGALFISTTLANAACIIGGDSGTNGSILQFYETPRKSNAIRGGARVGQCGIQMSSDCKGNWCFVRLDTLWGWVDTQYLDVNAQKASNTEPAASGSQSKNKSQGSGSLIGDFTYAITGGGGVVNMQGLKQNIPVDPGGDLVFKRIDENTYSYFSEISQQNVTLKLTGGTWRGVTDNWGVGIPMTLNHELFQLGASETSIALKGTGPMASVDMVLQLSLKNTGSSNTSSAQQQQTQNNANNNSQNSANNNSQNNQPLSPCDDLDRVETQVRGFGDPARNAELKRIKADAGVTPGGRITNGRCQTAADNIRTAGLLDPNWNGTKKTVNPKGGSNVKQANGNKQTLPTPIFSGNMGCGELQRAVAQIMRGSDGSLKAQLRKILLERQAFDLSRVASPVCLAILAELGLGSQAFNGEDPNTMIEGGKEIPGSEADFTPSSQGTSNNTQEPSTPQKQANGGTNTAENVCDTFYDAVIIIVSAGSVPEMRRLSQLLNQFGLNNSVTQNGCQKVLDTLFAEGML
ncbi:MAG: hypothetical protein AAGA53_06670 [Pseudomonadota bacterium]